MEKVAAPRQLAAGLRIRHGKNSAPEAAVMLAQAVLNWSGMKIIAFLAVLACIYLYFGSKTPVAEVVPVATGHEAAALSSGPKEVAPAPASTAKRSIDRTHAVLDRVAERNGAGEF